MRSSGVGFSPAGKTCVVAGEALSAIVYRGEFYEEMGAGDAHRPAGFRHNKTAMGASKGDDCAIYANENTVSCEN